MSTSPTSISILEDLIACPSVNPALDASGGGESDVAAYIEQRMRAVGLKTYRQEVFPGRDNLIVELRQGRSSTLLFEAHMDTVPTGNMLNALVPTTTEELLYGRGACDTKGSLAAMCWAMEQAAVNLEELSCDLVLIAVVDEEHNASGIYKFLELGLATDGAVVGEPTEMQIVIAHKGCARFAIHTHGKAAHSSLPHEGNNAIYQMHEVLSYVREVAIPELEAKSHPLCGTASLVVGKIEGGTQVNIVAAQCAIEIDRRILPGEELREVVDNFSKGLSEYVTGKGVQFTSHDLLLDPPLNTGPDTAIARHAQKAASSLGLSTELIGVPYGSDASKLGQAGIPSIVFGPGSIAQAHSDNEYVPVSEVELAGQFYLSLMKTFRGDL